MKSIKEWLENCRTIVCEGQYRHADMELSRKNYQMTARLSAMLARESEAGELVLFHL